jgi:arsenate reductase (thioredoxin)
MAIKPRVLFLCTENSCRTQMAEAFLRKLVGDELDIVSAGSESGRLDPDAVAAMREVGIDISSARTKVVDPYLRERFHYVITLCDRAKERSCPIFPGAIWRQIWPIESPAALQAAGLDQYLAVRHTRDLIRRQVGEFVEKYHQSNSGKDESAWN